MTPRTRSDPERNPWSCRRTPLCASALADGEEPPGSALALERHLLHCGECRKRTHEIRELAAVLDSLPGIEVSPQVRRSLLGAIREEIRNSPGRRRPHRRFPHLRLLGLPFAGGVLLYGYALCKVARIPRSGPRPIPPAPEFPSLLPEETLRAFTLLARRTLEGLGQLLRGGFEVPSLFPGPEAVLSSWLHLLPFLGASLGLLAMTTRLFLGRDLRACLRSEDPPED